MPVGLSKMTLGLAEFIIVFNWSVGHRHTSVMVKVPRATIVIVLYEFAACRLLLMKNIYLLVDLYIWYIYRLRVPVCPPGVPG